MGITRRRRSHCVAHGQGTQCRCAPGGSGPPHAILFAGGERMVQACKLFAPFCVAKVPSHIWNQTSSFKSRSEQRRHQGDTAAASRPGLLPLSLLFPLPAPPLSPRPAGAALGSAATAVPPAILLLRLAALAQSSANSQTATLATGRPYAAGPLQACRACAQGARQWRPAHTGAHAATF